MIRLPVRVIFLLCLFPLSACSTPNTPPAASPRLPTTFAPGGEPSPYPAPTQPEPYNPYPYPWTYSVPSITPGPSRTPWPSATMPATQTPSPSPTPFTPLDVDELTETDLQAMVSGQEVHSNEQAVLYQISQAPLGVRSLEWAPGGQQVALDVISGNSDPLHVTFTFPLILDTESQTAWSTLVEDTSYCLEHSDWSPDGQSLAYLDDRQLWIADARDGTSQLQALPPTAEGIYTLRYSPDGTQIALLSGRVQENRMVYDLWLRPSAGGKDRLLVEDAGYGTPVWSQDGRKLALLNEIGLLWIFDLDNGTTSQADLSPVPGSEVCLSSPEWVAESSKILAAIRHTANVWLVDLDGNAELFLPEESSSLHRHPGLAAPLRGGPNAGASASPDGSYAVYWLSGDDRHLIDFSTGKITLLENGIIGGLIAWSPTEAQFASTNRNSPFLLFDVRDGSTQEIDANGMLPSWSPDGRYIAYWKIEHQAQLDSFSLYISDTQDGTSWRYLGPDPENPSGAGGGWSYDLTPHWAPDGLSIAFVSNRRGDPQAYLLQLMSGILQSP